MIKVVQYIFLFLLACLPFFLPAQVDSLSIDLAKLTWRDIQQNDQIQSTQQVSSASRSLKDLKELPFTIHIITKAEIQQNGYITLADAVKMLPGFRISQPGSAIEGELFMMRGLIGNTYAKILINGIPIKPYMVNGMPIGAQLPIQQAARIEVIYGPAAALYGADAATGIINIVMENSERPIFTDASLHVGSDGYSSINVFLGGKLGKGKEVVKFNIWGSNTRMADRSIMHDQHNLFDIASYAAENPGRLLELEENLNFRGTIDQPIINELPHLSRAFGFDVEYKIFQVSFKNMHRQDHSSLGLNPLAVSYANPLTFIGEDIMEGNLVAKKQYDKFGFQTTIGFLNYDMDKRSSTIYLNPTLDFLFDSLATIANLSEMESERIHSQFFNRTRFAFANSLEYYAEQAFNFSVFEKGEFTMGFRFQKGDGQPFVDFQPNPVQANDVQINNLNPLFENPSYREYSAFGQLFLPLGKWNLLVGGQYLTRNNADFSRQVKDFNPRIALLYKVNKILSFRATYSTAFKIPAPYLNATTYTINTDNFRTITTGLTPLLPEKTIAYEVGLRWDISPKVDWDINGYFTKTTDFVTFDIIDIPNPNRTGFIMGYFNNGSSAAQLMGIQSMLRLKEIVPSIHLNAQISWGVSKGKEDFFTAQAGVTDGHISGINSLRSYPELITQARISFAPINRLLLTFDNVILTKSTTRNIVKIETILEQNNDATQLQNAEYYTLDIAANYQLSPNFSVYLKGFNIFNAKYAGIDGYNHPDILRHNPQSLTTYRLGVNYHLN